MYIDAGIGLRTPSVVSKLRSLSLQNAVGAEM
jgi:hypothetical protein